MKKEHDYRPSAVLVLAHGSVYWGYGCGAEGLASGEICFNTSMTGYQEIMTDPSYAGQIINFTAPHIGNVGVNGEDEEAATPQAKGVVMTACPTEPSNYRASYSLDEWLSHHGIVGIYGVDTRAITQEIRIRGAVGAVLYHGIADTITIKEDELLKQAGAIQSLQGKDLAKDVGSHRTWQWDGAKGGLWSHGEGYGSLQKKKFHVVAIDYGMKQALLRQLTAIGAEVTILSPQASMADIMSHKPDGVFLSNGPGDPEATAQMAVPVIQAVMKKNIPIFGVCLGHQLLAWAVGARTEKMALGHRGGNHPVRDEASGKIEITAQNHGFVVVDKNLPDHIIVTHRSLFDGSIEGIGDKKGSFFSVQHHPEASPGPHDAAHLFHHFADMMSNHQKKLSH